MSKSFLICQLHFSASCTPNVRTRIQNLVISGLGSSTWDEKCACARQLARGKGLCVSDDDFTPKFEKLIITFEKVGQEVATASLREMNHHFDY